MTLLCLLAGGAAWQMSRLSEVADYYDTNLVPSYEEETKIWVALEDMRRFGYQHLDLTTCAADDGGRGRPHVGVAADDGGRRGVRLPRALERMTKGLAGIVGQVRASSEAIATGSVRGVKLGRRE